jgi:hypothetical protein
VRFCDEARDQPEAALACLGRDATTLVIEVRELVCAQLFNGHILDCFHALFE